MKNLVLRLREGRSVPKPPRGPAVFQFSLSDQAASRGQARGTGATGAEAEPYSFHRQKQHGAASVLVAWREFLPQEQNPADWRPHMQFTIRLPSPSRSQHQGLRLHHLQRACRSTRPSAMKGLTCLRSCRVHPSACHASSALSFACARSHSDAEVSRIVPECLFTF
jgi:hypothetical protein